jgi:WD40 repeat protein
MENKIKILLFFLCGLCLVNNAYSQKIVLFNTDASEFPKVSTGIYVFDNSGKRVTQLDTLQFRVFENGMERWMKKINCPPPVTPKAFSSVLTVDISHSMRDYNRMNIAKSATKAWVNSMSNASSECAVTSFDAFTYINHPFSTNKNSLIASINQLQPKSGTNYTAAFLGDSGAIKLAAQGKYKKFIIFLTDGEPDESYPANPIEIINAAKKANITIYCVAIGLGNSTILRMIADSTGGKFFSNITNTAQAELTYIMILQNIEGTSPCTLEWQSGINCGRYRDVAITMPEYYIDTYTSYTIDSKLLPYLDITAVNKFDFGKVDSGKSVKTKIRITAKHRDTYIGPLVSNNPSFTILNNIVNTVLIGVNGYLDFDIEFKPKDTCRQSCRIDFFSDACSGNLFNLWGGVKCVDPPVIPDVKPEPPLKVEFPNGRETLFTGSDTTLSWKGISDYDTVKVEYSTNKGTSWQTITNNAIAGKFRWRVPNTPSKECLLRVGNIDYNPSLLDSAVVFGYGQITSADFSPDGKYAVSRSSNGYLLIWDVVKGKVIKKITNETNYLDMVEWSSRDKIAFGGKSNNVKVYDLSDNKLVEMKTELDGNLTALSWNPDGNRLACGDNGGKITVLNTEYQYVVQTLKEYSSSVKCISWEPLGFDMVSGHADGKVLIWRMSSGKPVIDYSDSSSHGNLVTAVAWSPAGDLIASGGIDHRIIIRNIDGTLIQSLDAHAGRVSTLSWNTSGTELISGSDDNRVKVWTNKGSLIKVYREHSNKILKVRWKKNASEFFSASTDNNIFLRNSNSDLLLKELLGHASIINSISFNSVIPDYAITTENSNRVVFWDCKLGEALRTIIDNESKITCAVYNQAADKIAIGYENGLVKIFNAGTTNLMRTLGPSNGHSAKVNSIDWNPDGTGLVSGSDDNVIKIWEPGGGTLVGDIKSHTDKVLSVDWSPDGRYIASGSADNNVCIINVSQLKVEKSLIEHKDDVITVNWDANGDSLVTGSKDGIIMIWNTLNPRQAKMVLQFAEKASPPAQLVWNPNHNTLLSAGGNLGALLWDTDYGFVKYKFPLTDSPLTYNSVTAKWDVKGKKLLTSSNAGTLHLFHLKDIPKFIQSDKSDTLWTILAPRVISTDVYMGNINVGKDTTKIAYAFLANLTKATVRIDSIKLKGNDIIHFDFYMPTVPFQMTPFEVKSATFTFHPDSEGEKSCTFTIFTQNEVLEHIISGIGVDRSYTTYNINFGEVEVGSFKDTTTTVIRNNSLIDVYFDRIVKNDKDCDYFIIDDADLQPFNLSSKTEFVNDIRFQPDKSGYFNCKLQYYPVGEQYPAVTSLSGYGVINKPTLVHQFNQNIHLQCDERIIDTVFIQNIGREQLSINSSLLKINEANAFEILSYPLNPLDSGVTDYLLLQFKPEKAGIYQAQIEIINNSTNEPNLIIDISALKDSIGITLSKNKFLVGPLCPNESKQELLSIENTGDYDNQFTIIADTIFSISNKKFNLSKGEKSIIELNINAFSETDTIETFIIIQDSICNKSDTISIEIQIEQPKIYTQNIIISTDWGSKKIGKLGISNFSSRDVIVDSISATEQLPIKILTNVKGLLIPANETKEIEIEYFAEDTVALSTTFILYAQPCDLIEFLSVTGIPKPTQIEVSIDTIYASNNDKIKIPINFINDKKINFNNEFIQMNLSISFNSSLLYPVGNINSRLSGFGIMENALRVVDLKYLGNDIKENLIIDSDFLVMLGNSDRTEIVIDSAYFNTDFIKAKTSNGLLILNDICKEGGLQLVQSVDNLQIIAIEPNPVEEQASIQLYAPESNIYSIQLVNNLGQVVKNMDNLYLEQGFRNLNIMTADISNGTYFIILRNSKSSSKKIFQVLR